MKLVHFYINIYIQIDFLIFKTLEVEKDSTEFCKFISPEMCSNYCTNNGIYLMYVHLMPNSQWNVSKLNQCGNFDNNYKYFFILLVTVR